MNNLDKDKSQFDQNTNKSITCLPRDKLESLLRRRTRELVEANTDILQLQRSCADLQADVRLWKTKSDDLARKCSHLAGLLRKYFAQSGGRPAAPSEISRIPSGVPSRVEHTDFSDTPKDVSVKKRKSEDISDMPEKKKTKPAPPALPESEKIDFNGEVDTDKKTSFTSERLELNSVSETPDLELDNLPDLPDPVRDSAQPKPSLSLNQTEKALEVIWDYNTGDISSNQIKDYELLSLNISDASPAWKKLSPIKSLKLPIKVTLSDFKSGSSHCFAVRARSLDETPGPYSDVQKIYLK